MSKKIVKINGIDVFGALGYVFDGCHKFYVIEDETDVTDVKSTWHSITVAIEPLTDDMFHAFLKSCPLRFISNWKLTKRIVPQTCDMDEDECVEFEFEDGTIGIYDPFAEYHED